MFSKIKADKWRHFIAGIPMGAILQALSSFFLQGDIVLATVIAFVIVLFISYGFELFSKITGLGHYDVMDAVVSAVGGVLGMCLSLLAQFYLFQ